MLKIGTIDSVHGLKGEVVVNLLSNVDGRLKPNSEFVVQENLSQKLIVRNARKHKKKYIVEFEGIHTRDAAETLRGITLMAEPLKIEDTLWMHELIGCEAVDQNGKNHGKVSAMEANPASDLLVLESGALIPVVFVKSHTQGKILIDIPKGLIQE